MSEARTNCTMMSIRACYAHLFTMSSVESLDHLPRGQTETSLDLSPATLVNDCKAIWNGSLQPALQLSLAKA